MIIEEVREGYFSILKGKGPKGHTWTKGPDGKRIYSNSGGATAPAVAAPATPQATPQNTPQAAATPHDKVRAWGDKMHYDKEDLKGGSTVHSLQTTGPASGFAALKGDSDLHTHLLSQGYKQVGETSRDFKDKVNTSQFEHPNGSKVQTMAAYDRNKATGHSFSVTPPRDKAPAAPITPTTTAPKGVTGKTLLTSAKLKKLADLTDMNDHGGAIIHGSKMLGRQDLADEATKIRNEHNKLGGLNQDLLDRRNAVYTKMMDHAKANLHPSDLAKFHGAF